MRDALGRYRCCTGDPMEMNNHKITIHTQSKYAAFKAVYIAAAQILVIGVGVITESQAMQWAGFLLLALMVYALAIDRNRKMTGISIADARKLLDELERAND
jgi:hypothetical protein